MKKRITLFNLESQIPLRSIANNMLGIKYKESNSVGFLLNSVDSSKIKGKHICKIEIVEEDVNPFGESYKRTTEQYIVNDFVLYDDFLELHNPSKTLKYFKKDLLMSFGKEVKIYDFNINTFGLLDFSLRNYKKSYIKEVDILSYDIIDDSISKMNVKGNGDILGKINKLFVDNKYEISKFSLVFSYLNSPDMTVYVGEKGGVSFSSTDLVEELVKSFLDSIKLWEKK